MNKIAILSAATVGLLMVIFGAIAMVAFAVFNKDLAPMSASAVVMLVGSSILKYYLDKLL